MINVGPGFFFRIHVPYLSKDIMLGTLSAPEKICHLMVPDLHHKYLYTYVTEVEHQSYVISNQADPLDYLFYLNSNSGMPHNTAESCATTAIPPTYA